MTEDIPSENARQWRIPLWFQDLDDVAMRQIKSFHTELIAFNGRINLISPRSESNSDRIHISDAIMGSRYVLEHTDASRIYDLGSGNGIPGIILAIIAPDRDIVAVDSDARKIEFLKHCAYQFNIKNFSALHSRVDELPDNSIEAAVSRGLAPIPKLLLLLRKQVVSEGKVFHFKGSQWSNELASLPPQLITHWSGGVAGHYTLPDSSADMTIVVTTRK